MAGRSAHFVRTGRREATERVKRGIDTYAKHVCRRRRDGSQYFPLFVLFVLFGQAKRTLKEKKHNVTFLLSYFSVTKSTKSHQRERSPLSRRRQPTHCVHWSIPLSLKTLPCRLAATSANKVPRPSDYSLAMATGSKRPAPTRIHCCAMSSYGEPRGN